MTTPIQRHSFDDENPEHSGDSMSDYLVPCVQGVTLYFLKVRADSANAATELVKRMDGHYGCGVTVAQALEPDELVSLVADFHGEDPTYVANAKGGSEE